MDEKEKIENIQTGLPEEYNAEFETEVETESETEPELSLEEQVRQDIKKERKQNAIEWIKDIIIAAILAAIILAFIKPIIVQQESMLDNYLPGDYVIISRQAYNLFGEPERGDVIVFKTDMDDGNGNEKNLIKRIIGLPGERVEVRSDGYVYIDGELLDEPYIREQGISDQLAGEVDIIVGEDELFVCGDNRAVSLDSRSIGCIKQDQIMGKVKWLILNTQGLRKGN